MNEHDDNIRAMKERLAKARQARADEKSTKFRIPHPNEPGAERVVAAQLIDKGWPAIAVWGAKTDHPNRGKAPRGDDWQRTADFRAAMAARLRGGDNVGIIGGQYATWHPALGPVALVGFDYDVTFPDAAAALRNGNPDSPIRTGKPPKYLFWGLVPALEGYSTDYTWTRGENERFTLQIIGISRKANRGPRHAVGFGMHPGTMRPYSYEPDSNGCTIFDLSPSEFPIIDINAELARADAAVAPLGWTRKVRKPPSRRVAQPQNALGSISRSEAEHLAVWARNKLAKRCSQLLGRGENTGRGTDVWLTMTQIAPVIGAGALSVDEAEAMIGDATHFPDVQHDFDHALAADVDIERNIAIKELARFRRRNGFTAPGADDRDEDGHDEDDAGEGSSCGESSAEASEGGDGDDPFSAFRQDEEIPPLTEAEADELVRKVEEGNVGAPLVSETLAKIAALKRRDRAAFEVLRKRLKDAGVRVTFLDEALKEQAGPKPNQSDVLVSLVKDATLYCDGDEAYADVIVNGHRETWPVQSKGFRRWLTGRYLDETKGVPNNESMSAAIRTIDAMAVASGKRETVHIRVGSASGKIYIDMADDKWRAIEVDQNGWRVVAQPPVKFRRSQGMQPLPEPLKGGSIILLREHLNVASDDDLILTIAWMIGALRGDGPYPLMSAGGEHGTAKSTYCRRLRATVDPHAMLLRSLPRDKDDLFISALNNHVVAYDNVSSIPAWLSDDMCALATGGGVGKRELYTNRDEVILSATKPMIFNGIGEVVHRADLADRALFVTLQLIEEQDRKREKKLNEAFAADHPKILGALLDAVSAGLSRFDQIELDETPRMADFAHWVVACETAFVGVELSKGRIWQEGDFMRAYKANRDQAMAAIIEADPVVGAVTKFINMSPTGAWRGTATDLLGNLTALVSPDIARSKAWPALPHVLSSRLTRAAPLLRWEGVDVTIDRGGDKRSTRSITIKREAYTWKPI